MRFDLDRLGKPPSCMSESEFVAVFGGIYEHSPWVARETWERGLDESHDTVAGLSGALAATVEAASDDAKLALIRAHPDLAGRAAVQGGLGRESTREQASAGIDQCTEEEFERFHALNDAYRERFGFPFVMAVKGGDRRAILSAFEERLEHDAGEEFERAVAEIHRIACLRLADLAEAG